MILISLNYTLYDAHARLWLRFDSQLYIKNVLITKNWATVLCNFVLYVVIATSENGLFERAWAQGGGFDESAREHTRSTRYSWPLLFQT